MMQFFEANDAADFSRIYFQSSFQKKIFQLENRKNVLKFLFLQAPEPDETMAVTLRNERFFDEVPGQAEQTPAFLMAVSALSQPKRPSLATARLRRIVVDEKKLDVPEVKVEGRAPMAEPEDETDLMGPRQIMAQAIRPPRRSRFPGMDFMSRFCPGSSRFKKDAQKAQEERLASLLDHR